MASNKVNIQLKPRVTVALKPKLKIQLKPPLLNQQIPGRYVKTSSPKVSKLA